MRKLLALISLLIFPSLAWAHIGSPNVIYEGLAGPYPLRVVIRPPGVVPGLADISVRVLQGRVDRITVLPVRYDTGSKGSPAPDEASPVRGEANLYGAQLWLMTSGAHSIFVNVEGPAGPGTTVIPINSVATTRLQIPWWFGGALLAFGVFLVLALVSIVGAAVREGVLPPGEPAARSWRARLAMIVASVVLVLLLFGGRKWWDSVDSEYRNNRLYKPEPIAASLRAQDGKRILALERLDNRRGRPRLIPDHGKLMHVFLVRKPEQDAFAHLHPIHIKAHVYESVLPPLPVGNYRLYADVTHESGFSQTLTTELSLTNSVESSDLSDPDDAWTVATPTPSQADQTTFALPDGLTLKWDSAGPLIAGNETSLRFRLLETNGAPAVLEPYLGMQGHAVIEEQEGRVFTHIHPFGNISMASQQRFVERERTRGAKPNLEVVCGLPNKGDAIVFPYEFPRAGQYRIWVQVKTHGRIMTAFFDARVIEKAT